MQLLAKAPNADKPLIAGLVRHTKDVVVAGYTLLSYRMPILKAMGVQNRGKFQELLHDAVILACCMHDIGKASDFFQEMLKGRQQNNHQPLTHEIISGLLMSNIDIREWLYEFGVDDRTFFFALAAVVGHHRRFDSGSETIACPVRIAIDRSHEDFLGTLRIWGGRFNAEPPSLGVVEYQKSTAQGRLGYAASLANMKDELQDNVGYNLISTDERKTLAATKALTIAADVCASAVAGRFYYKAATNVEFVADYASRLLDSALTINDMAEVIADWAWSNVETNETRPTNRLKLPGKFSPHPFQIEVAHSPSNLTLAQAGCGSGKSLAAYMWARERIRMSGGGKGRLIYTLPTTGTSTEHYRDYALHSGVPERFKNLGHSRAEVDLIYEDDGDDALRERRGRIEALDMWGTPLCVCTVDTVLGIMANQRKPIYSFPAIMQSCIVFDEIHAYDDVMFGHMMVFLKNFTGIPTLLMTASLPAERLEAIREIRPDLNVVHGDKKHEEIKRYCGISLTHPVVDDNMVLVEDRIRQYIDLYPDCKILWVRNQVKWAVDAYKTCLDKFGDIADVDLYHSRYRYKDRVQVHRRVIDRFQHSKRPSILVATQVAEMSLNLSAHLLITDACEIAGIIQRMGRLNRGSDPLPAPAGRAIVCRVREFAHNKMDCYPYSQDQIQDAVRWTQELSEQSPLSQKDLAEALERYRNPMVVDMATAEGNAAFLRGAWETEKGGFRDDNPTITVILEEDYKDFIESGEGGGKYSAIQEWMRKHETNMVYKPIMGGWAQYRGVTIAPSTHVTYGSIDDPDPKQRVGAEWVS